VIDQSNGSGCINAGRISSSCHSLSLASEGVCRFNQPLRRHLPVAHGSMSQEQRSRPWCASDLSRDSRKRTVMCALPQETVIEHEHLIGSALPLPNQPGSRFQFDTSTPPDLSSLVELLCNVAELALALRAEPAERDFRPRRGCWWWRRSRRSVGRISPRTNPLRRFAATFGYFRDNALSRVAKVNTEP
jgi:hypothetical protein